MWQEAQAAILPPAASGEKNYSVHHYEYMRGRFRAKAGEKNCENNVRYARHKEWQRGSARPRIRCQSRTATAAGVLRYRLAISTINSGH